LLVAGFPCARPFIIINQAAITIVVTTNNEAKLAVGI